MSMSRRDFMKFVGISISSLLLTNCRRQAPTPPPATIACYLVAAPPPDDTPTNTKLTDPKAKLRAYWLSFGDLASKTQAGNAQDSSEDTYGQELIEGHRAALDELISAGALTRVAADLVEEAYEAAVYHVWRSNSMMTCYLTAGPTFAPESAQSLVQQSEALDQLASQGTIDPQTLETARQALEHDMAFYTLSNDQVQALYQSLTDELNAQGQGIPEFADVELDVSPDAKAAAQFIIDLLTLK